MSEDIALAVATAIDAAGVATLTVDLFVDDTKMPNSVIPAQAIFVQESDGFMPEAYLGGRKIFRRRLVEINVRSDSYRNARDLAKAALEAVDHKDLVLTNFIWCKAQTSGPVYTGTGKNDEHEFYAVVEVGIEESLQ